MEKVEQVREQLLARGPKEWAQCANDLNIKPITVQRFAQGVTPAPRVDTFMGIADWLIRTSCSTPTH